MAVYRVHIQRNNADKTQKNVEAFVEANSPRSAVEKTLANSNLEEFGSINVNLLPNGIIIE